MYTEYFSLSSMPFRLSPDGRFFFGSHEHTRAMAFLNYGLAEREGFVIITGEVGAGKTTLIEHLFATLERSRFSVGRIVTTQLNSYEIIRMVASCFSIPHEGRDKSALLIELKQLFDSLSEAGRSALLVVDEAQSLTGDAIEELRMLSNLQRAEQNSFQVILVGQPEFRQLLASPGFEQVRQRVSASYHLGPLNLNDTRLYVEHRLRQVGWRSDPQISEGAFAQIYRFTGGIPRRINILFSRLLLLAYLDQRHEIDAEMVDRVARELAAELGPAAPATHALAQNANNAASYEADRSRSGDSIEAIENRITRIEQKLVRHKRIIERALDLAYNHLGGETKT